MRLLLVPTPVLFVALALAGCASMCETKTDTGSTMDPVTAPAPTSTEEPAYLRRLHASKGASALPSHASSATTAAPTAAPPSSSR